MRSKSVNKSATTGKKLFVSSLLSTILAFSGLVLTAPAAHAVTWTPWDQVPIRSSQVQGMQAILPTDLTLPYAFDAAFKPVEPWTVGTGLEINPEFEFYYGTFAGGYGACADNGGGAFTCPGGITVQTTQPAGNPYTVTAALVQKTNAEELAITPSWNPTPQPNLDRWSSMVKVTWTSTTAVNFQDTLTEVHFPANSVVMPTGADLLKGFMLGSTPYKSMVLAIAGYGSNGTPKTNGYGSGVFALASQTMAWNPNTNLSLGASPATPSAAAIPSGSSPAVVGYYKDPSSTSDCTVNALTGVMTYSTVGTCVVRAVTRGDTTYGLAEKFVTFNITSTPGVTFTAGTGSGTPPTVPAGNVATMPDGTGMTPPAGSGAFAGWSCFDGTTTSTVAAGAALTVTAATTCDAQWTPYPITFGLNGGSGTAHANMSGVITMPDGTGMTPPAGKFFDGWTCTPGGAVAAGAQFTPTAASSCLPVWTGFAVNFDTGTGGGAAPTSTTGVTVLPGQGSMTAPTGTAFGGWNCTPPSPAVHYSAGASFTPTATSQCSAQWDVIHVVSFATGSGAGTAPVSQNSPIASMPLQGGMTAPAGFGFGGWSCFDGTNTLSVAAGAPYSPAADATCTAQWTAFTVTFTTGSGSGTAPTGGPGVIPAMPDGTGMTGANGSTFNGWLCTPGGLVAAGAAFTPSANSSCVAQWLPLATPAPQKKLVVVMVNNSTIVEGKPLPTFTTNVDSDLSSLSCSVYSRSDKNYSSSLAANQLTAANSPYVIHCSYFAKEGIEVVAYSDGVLNVDQARTPGAGSGNGGGTGTASAGTHKLVAKYYFNGDSPKLRAATIAGLKKLAKKVGAKVNVVVAVQGFVKRTKVTSYDYRLSLDRALNIVAYLKKLGVKASFSADSRGIATENNAKARRAEVTITW